MDKNDRDLAQLVERPQTTQSPDGVFPSSALSEYVREWGMTCPKCQSQNAKPFMSWTLSGRKRTIPQLRLWACQNAVCLHQWPRKLAGVHDKG